MRIDTGRHSTMWYSKSDRPTHPGGPFFMAKHRFPDVDGWRAAVPRLYTPDSDNHTWY